MLQRVSPSEDHHSLEDLEKMLGDSSESPSAISGTLAFDVGTKEEDVEALVHLWWRKMGEVEEGTLWRKAQRCGEQLEQAGLAPEHLCRDNDSHQEFILLIDKLFEQMNAHQVLCLQHHGSRGTHAIQRYATTFRQGTSVKTSRKGTPTLQVGDRVMVTRNLHHLDLFNGDIGCILPWQGEEMVVFKRGERFIQQHLRRIRQHLSSAHSISVHKSQGSEYNRVLLLLPEQDGPLVSREILYTAITRAKNFVLMAGSEERFMQGCRRSINRPSAVREWAVSRHIL